jgi:hypothetical protein
MKVVLYLIAFAVIVGVSAEFLINRSSNTLLTFLFIGIVLAAFYFLIYKQLKRFL